MINETYLYWDVYETMDNNGELPPTMFTSIQNTIQLPETDNKQQTNIESIEDQKYTKKQI